ncbi:MAG: TldD/PmbA family protein [Planctomycetes bacterium]|nr:TldD/PmbA family protein [Planctomycetota bacterium]
MPLLERKDSVTIARGIISKSKATETEVVIDSAIDRFVRYAEHGPTQDADRGHALVRVRVRNKTPEGYREATASCGSLEPAAYKAALERAQELALVAPPNPRLAPLGGAVMVPMVLRDRATIDQTFEAKARWIKLATEACAKHGLFPAGLAQTTGISRAIVNSCGREVLSYQTRAAFSLTATGKNGEGWAEAIARTIGALPIEATVQRAIDKALAAQDPEPIEPGEYTVVLEPAAVASLLLFTGYEGFGAREYEEQTSFLCGRLGQQVFPPSVTIHDDYRHPAWASLPFDGEGTARTQVVLVENGVPKRVVTDRNHAAHSGGESTGHALLQPSSHGPMPQNLVLLPGKQSRAELVAGVERGLLVTQLHYVNLMDPRELLLTGITRNGTYRIENGKLGRAVRNLRFTDSLVRTLGTLSGISNEQVVCGALFDGECVVPALRLSLRFTSTTEF